MTKARVPADGKVCGALARAGANGSDRMNWHRTLWACMLALSGPAQMHAADLQQQTVRAWDRYLFLVRQRMIERVRAGGKFLWADESPERLRKVRRGMIVAVPYGNDPIPVPNGLIHDWVGAEFLPGASLQEVFSVVRDYARYKAVYQLEVVASKPLGYGAAEDHFSMTVVNRERFTRSALEGDYEQHFCMVDSNRWYAITRTLRLQEVEEFGSDSEHRLPSGEGSGYIWRLFSVSRFEQREAGVYVEVEAVALSRQIPISLRWLVNPIVRRVARSALVTSLNQTRQAVHHVAKQGVCRMDAYRQPSKNLYNLRGDYHALDPSIRDTNSSDGNFGRCWQPRTEFAQ